MDPNPSFIFSSFCSHKSTNFPSTIYFYHLVRREDQAGTHHLTLTPKSRTPLSDLSLITYPLSDRFVPSDSIPVHNPRTGEPPKMMEGEWPFLNPVLNYPGKNSQHGFL